jgi:hypothetical protein
MKKIGELYTKTVYRHFRPFHANWDPAQPVDLGDYGELRGKTFHRLGNIRELGIEFSAAAGAGATSRQFESSGLATIEFTSRVKHGGAVTANAKAALKFAMKNSVFFNIAGCSYTAIKGQAKLGKEVLDTWNRGKGKWKRAWVVITDVVRADSTTILISGTSSATAVLEADARFPKVDFANASIGLRERTMNHVGYKIVGKSGMTPLFKLWQIQSRWWGFGHEYGPKTSGLLEGERKREYFCALLK